MTATNIFYNFVGFRYSPALMTVFFLHALNVRLPVLASICELHLLALDSCCLCVLVCPSTQLLS